MCAHESSLPRSAKAGQSRGSTAGCSSSRGGLGATRLTHTRSGREWRGTVFGQLVGVSLDLAEQRPAGDGEREVLPPARPRQEPDDASTDDRTRPCRHDPRDAAAMQLGAGARARTSRTTGAGTATSPCPRSASLAQAGDGGHNPTVLDHGGRSRRDPGYRPGGGHDPPPGSVQYPREYGSFDPRVIARFCAYGIAGRATRSTAP